VILADGSTWIGQSGVGVLASKAPLGADTLFSVGSISKTFTGALALRLAERGVISLNDRLSRWVPSFPNAARITLRELLNHTSGLRDMFEPAIYKFIGANHSATWTPQQVLARIGAPYFAPGKGYHYSSTNYILLGLALEKAGGKSLASMIRTEFLDPLGLTHTFLQGEEQISGTLAHGYLGPPSAPKDVSVGQAMLPYVSVATAAGAAGGFVSTPGDIARWASALYGGQLLNKASMTAMYDLSASRPYHPTYLYGLAVEQLPVAGHLAWGHRGHLDGFWSTMAYLPDTHLTVVVTMNADWPDPLRTVGVIVKAALG
jgi:D-alanyl-D-alanine carboxypeptidase